MHWGLAGPLPSDGGWRRGWRDGRGGYRIVAGHIYLLEPERKGLPWTQSELLCFSGDGYDGQHQGECGYVESDHESSGLDLWLSCGGCGCVYLK